MSDASSPAPDPRGLTPEQVEQIETPPPWYSIQHSPWIGLTLVITVMLVAFFGGFFHEEAPEVAAARHSAAALAAALQAGDVQAERITMATDDGMQRWQLSAAETMPRDPWDKAWRLSRPSGIPGAPLSAISAGPDANWGTADDLSIPIAWQP